MNKLIITIQDPMFTFGTTNADALKQMLRVNFPKLLNDGMPFRLNDQKEIDEGIFVMLTTEREASTAKVQDQLCAVVVEGAFVVTYDVKVSQYYGGDTEKDLDQVTCMDLS